MQVGRTAPQADVEVDEPASPQVERRRVQAGHRAVEDDARVGTALVLGEEVDDRVAADLLLTVEGDADVDRQRALEGELLSSLESQIGVALVVGRAARVQVKPSRISGSNGGDSQSSSGAGGCTSKCP
jgi:hypothetical protein